MDDKRENIQEEQKHEGPASAEWATEALEEMDDFIESQGIYIRQ